MGKTNVEILFEWMDKTTHMIEQHQNESYLDSLGIVLDMLFYQQVSSEFDDILEMKLMKQLQHVNMESFSREEINKATQLVILKGMRNGIQPNHQMTPEAIALFIGYLAAKFMQSKDPIRIFDPVCGTANLFTIVLNQLQRKFQAYASEVDPTLIRIAAGNANLQKLSIEFFHQDSLRPFMIDPVDLLVADLPVGYYPNEDIANLYQLKADEGHSYAHHLLIEQSINYTKEAGYLFFLIPEFLFNSEQSERLYTYLSKHAHIVGVIKLPESAFISKKDIKSILILQKKGTHTKGPKQPLLVDLPSFSNEAAMADIMNKINQWFTVYFQARE